MNYGFRPNLHIPPFSRSPRARPSRPSRQVTPPAVSLERTAGPAPAVPVTPSSPLSPSAAPLSPTAACAPRPTSQVVPAAPSVDALVLSAAESRFRDAVDSFTSADWAREQQPEFERNACIRYILLDCPPELPPDFFDDVPSHRRTPFADIKELADQGRLVYDNGVCLFVRKPSKAPAVASGRPGGRFARLLNDEPVRLYVPMRMRPWAMLAIHANALCRLGAARTLSLLERFFWWVGMNEVTRFLIRKCRMCQARKTSRQTVRWPTLTIALPSGPGVAISIDYFGPLPTTSRGNSYIVFLIDRFSRRANMYAVTDAEFTAEGTADILVNKYITVWGCPTSILSDNGEQFCSKLSAAVYELLKVRKIATSAYHPRGNGGVERVNHTLAQMLAMVVNERQDNWDEHLPHVEFAYNNSVSAATGLSPNEVHMARLPRYPLTVFDNIYARRHQSLARNQLEYCNLAADRQKRAYDLVREQHALTVSRMDRRISKLSNALHKRPVYSVGGWVWLYNSAATIRQGSKLGPGADLDADAQVR